MSKVKIIFNTKFKSKAKDKFKLVNNKVMKK